MRSSTTSERPNLHFVGSAEPMPNHDLSGQTDAELMPKLNHTVCRYISPFSQGSWVHSVHSMYVIINDGLN